MAGALAGGSVLTGGLTTASVAFASAPQTSGAPDVIGKSDGRENDAFLTRQRAALANSKIPYPGQRANGDEQRYASRIGNFSKGLPHDARGIVDGSAYDSLLAALQDPEPLAFERIPLGGTVRLVNPQAGLAFELEGLDSHQSAIPAPPTFASAERAAEAIESYWMALLRDVNFRQYSSDETALAACAELSKLAGFSGPKTNAKVVPDTLFRGFTAGDALGPYVSQFLLRPLNYGAIPLEPKIRTMLSLASRGTDYLTDVATWLAAQNGQGPFEMDRFDPVPRLIRNGRDLAASVHTDQAYQEFLNTTLFFGHNKVPLNPGNPYRSSKTQSGFVTFGLPHVQGLLGTVSGCALRAVWYQKWFVHRTLRPEEFSGRVHFALSKNEECPIHPDIANSEAVARVQSLYGSFLLPQAFPEGSPQHPAYAQGHAVVAGACATVLKAFFDEKHEIAHFGHVLVPSQDGLSPERYAGADADELTIGNELDKLASNIALGRNHAGIHWRSDYVSGLLLGEAVAIAVLRDQRHTFSEDFHGLTFTRFDGTSTTV